MSFQRRRVGEDGESKFRVLFCFLPFLFFFYLFIVYYFLVREAYVLITVLSNLMFLCLKLLEFFHV